MGLVASCKTADLVREVAVVSKSASTKSMLPILSNVLIETTKGGLYLTATDLTSRLRAFVPGKVTKKGSTTVTIKDLSHLLHQFEQDGQTAFILQDDGRLLVADGQGTSGALPVIDPAEMPVRLDPSEWPLVAQIEARVLRDLIERSLPFVASDEARPILTGVNVHVTPGKITFGAADNYVVSGLDGTATSDVDSTAVIPSVSLKLLRGITDTGVAVEYRVSGTFINFAFGQYDLTIAGIDGQFPKYEQVLPAYTPWDGEIGSYAITVDRKAFLKALKLARRDDQIIHVVTGPESVAVKIPDPHGRQDGVDDTLFAKSIPATIVPARDEKIGFNPELLVRVLNAISAPTITMFRNDAYVATVYGIDTGDPASRYAIMPVRLMGQNPSPKEVPDAL